MNRLTKLGLSLMGATLLLVLAYPPIAKLVTTADGYGMEISIEGRKPFTMAVRANDERLAMLPFEGAQAAAVKIDPLVVNGGVRLQLRAVLDKLPEPLTCDQIKKLKTEAVATIFAREGDVIRVADFEKYGVAPFTLKVMGLAAVQTVCPDGACCCGGNTCYPNPGKCIECGSCGTCCRSGGGGGGEEFEYQ